MTFHNKESLVEYLQEVHIEINGGDPKERLLPQLWDIGRIEPKERPMFMITVNAGETELGLNINGIESVNGTGETWNISGYVVYVAGRINFDVTYSNRHFKGQYNCSTRKGWLKLLSN